MKKYIWKIKGLISAEILFGIFAAISIALVPNFEKKLVDKLFSSEYSNNTLFNMVMLFALCVAAICIFSYLSSIMEESWKSSMRSMIQTDFFDSLVETDYRWFRNKNVGEYISIETNNIDVIVEEYMQPVISLINVVIKICIYAVVMYLCIDWRVALSIFVMSVIVIFIPKIFKKRNGQLGNMSMEATGQYTISVKDYLEGIKLINNNTRRFVLQQHNKAVDKMTAAKIKRGLFGIFSMSMEVFGIKIMELMVFIIVALLLIRGDLTAGMVIAVFSYSAYFIGPLQEALNKIDFINSRRTVKEKFIEAININRQQQKNLHKLSNFKDKITMKNVCLSYDNFKLNNICCCFEKGKKYAIIGHSGSGKSTMINLLMKYEMPDSGEISIDGCNIASLNIDDIVMCISQKEHIYRESFENNVTVFGSYSRSSFSEILNNYSNSILDKIKHKENCSDLSGGEKQLTSFIRSLVSGNDVLIMDEPFSAMDAGTLKKVIDILFELEDKTIIMVTHNLGMNLDKFDEVILMDDGSIVENDKFNKVRENHVFRSKMMVKN
ncbi:hypothetical protein C3495_14015 (plasmid) [Clostridiaceae bacterium 14S0207]|nr:hypothetical protein C3495_14015 [Clostridiaceae bacterium 14S0207]